jgi:hypothetical protein
VAAVHVFKDMVYTVHRNAMTFNGPAVPRWLGFIVMSVRCQEHAARSEAAAGNVSMVGVVTQRAYVSETCVVFVA